MDSMEAAGGLITGGLIAKLLSRRENRRNESTEDHPGVCSDCGATVSGKYCSECGQPTHVHRSLLHLGEEMLHGVLHFDARIWRTLPLLAINPGRLTREWVQGKRTRYVSPLAIFLLLVGFLGVGLGLKPRDVPSPLVNRPMPAFSLPTLDQPERKLGPQDLRGQVYLINVWASWCTACQAEHPLLVDLCITPAVPPELSRKA